MACPLFGAISWISDGMLLIRKQTDYVFGECQYKILSIKKAISDQINLRGKNNRQYFGNV